MDALGQQTVSLDRYENLEGLPAMRTLRNPIVVDNRSEEGLE